MQVGHRQPHLSRKALGSVSHICPLGALEQARHGPNNQDMAGEWLWSYGHLEDAWHEVPVLRFKNC